VIKGRLSEKEILALLETERIKTLLDVPRTNLRRDGMFVISDCLYDYDVESYHICKSGIDKGERISNIKLKKWTHTPKNTIQERSFLKALALRLILGTDDTVPCNFILIDDTVYSVDDPAWKIEPQFVWKITAQKDYYSAMLDRHWEWVSSFLNDWLDAGLCDFSNRMIVKYLDRKNWCF